MTTTINFSSSVNGLATDVTSVKLSDSGGAYGLRRIDNGDIVVADGTALNRLSVGSYQLPVTDPAADLTYDYVIEVVANGTTYHYPRIASSGLVLNHVFSVPTNSHYSSEAEVMRFLGEHAVAAMMEDWESTDRSPVWRTLLQTVDNNIDQYITQHYNRSDVLSNSFIRTQATIMASHLLSMRRGNPGVYQRLNDEVYGKLELIQNHRLHIPGARPLANRAPVIRVYRMQPFSIHPVRVVQSKSTGAAYAGVDYAWEPFFGYWI